MNGTDRSDLFTQIRDALLDCDPFQSNMQLRALFQATPALRPWEDSLPEGSSPLARAEAAIGFLHDRYNDAEENALVLLLAALAARLDEADALRARLHGLSETLAGTLTELAESGEKPAWPPAATYRQERRLEAATPREAAVGEETEVRVLVALADSEGLKAYLPDWTEHGDLIAKDDVTHSIAPVEFPVDPGSGQPVPIDLFIRVRAPAFSLEGEQNVRQTPLSPEHDSGVITFFLTPQRRDERARIVVELFRDARCARLLGSVTLISAVRTSLGQMVRSIWQLATASLGGGLPPAADVPLTKGGAFTFGDLEAMPYAGSDATVGQEDPLGAAPASANAEPVHLFGLLFRQARGRAGGSSAAVQAVRALREEVGKGEGANDERLAALIEELAGTSPAVAASLIQLFALPSLARLAGSATRSVLRRLEGL